MTAFHSPWAGCYTLWWVSSPLFGKMSFLCRDTGREQAPNIGCCSAHFCLCTAAPSVSSVMLGFVWQCLSHGQCSLWVTALERYLLKGHRRHARDPTCSVGTSSRVIRRNQALPAIWSETTYILVKERGQNPFAWMLQGFIFSTASKIQFMVENTCCWIMFTRKEHLKMLFLGNSEPREECLLHTRITHFRYHSKPHNMIEVSCPIPAGKESRTTIFTMPNQGSWKCESIEIIIGNTKKETSWNQGKTSVNAPAKEERSTCSAKLWVQRAPGKKDARSAKKMWWICWTALKIQLTSGLFCRAVKKWI